MYADYNFRKIRTDKYAAKPLKRFPKKNKVGGPKRLYKRKAS